MRHISLFLLCCFMLQSCSNKFWTNATDIQTDQKILLVSTFPESFHIKQIHSYLFSFTDGKDVDVKSWNINNLIKENTVSSLQANYQIELLDTSETFVKQPEKSFFNGLQITDAKLLSMAEQKQATYIMMIHPKKINHIPDDDPEKSNRIISGIGLYNNEYVHGGRKIQHALINVSLFDSKTGELIFTSNNAGIAYHDLPWKHEEPLEHITDLYLEPLQKQNTLLIQQALQQAFTAMKFKL